METGNTAANVEPDPTRLRVAVQILREAKPNAWQPWRFEVMEVTVDAGQHGQQQLLLRDDGRTAHFLHPGLEVRLHRDEAQGYYLNLSSGTPVWFVMWRHDEADPPNAWPEFVTLSYDEAGRLLDAQEKVDNVPLPPDVAAWLQAYVDEHYQPEPRKRRRPASFKPTHER